MFWLCKYVFCVQFGNVVKELAKLANIMANGQKKNGAPLVLASNYRGMEFLVIQIKENKSKSGHGPLLILQLWLYAYFPKFGSEEQRLLRSR